MNTISPVPPSAPRLEAGRPVHDQTWMRLPRPVTRCSTSGLSRQSLAELVRPCARNNFTPPVEARLLKRKGSKRGILLISRGSLLSYINGLPAPGATNETEAAAMLTVE